MMKFHPYGDSAVLINFEQKIDPEINAKVIAIADTLENSEIKGLVSYIPAYCSITIIYNPLVTVYDEICEQVEELVAKSRDGKVPDPRTLNIPVCYEGDCSLDLEEVRKQTGLSPKSIIEIHTSITFQVYMLGFLPGFVYMGSLPESLSCARKPKPRLRVPPRSVGLAGLQTGIYPSEAPGGWQIIGKTPLNIFDGKNENPFLFKAGDQVKFHAISTKAHLKFELKVESGSFNIEEIYGQ